jgi:hypothetical protein
MREGSRRQSLDCFCILVKRLSYMFNSVQSISSIALQGIKCGWVFCVPQWESKIRSDCYIVTVKLNSLQLATRGPRYNLINARMPLCKNTVCGSFLIYKAQIPFLSKTTKYKIYNFNFFLYCIDY